MAKQPILSDVGARSSGAPKSSPDRDGVAALVAGLSGLDIASLGLRWRNHLGGTVPAHLPRWLLIRVFAYSLQAAAEGDLDRATLRRLRPRGAGSDDVEPFATRQAATRDGTSLTPGAVLVREWKGQLLHVMVLDEGFAWNGATYGSLSRAAKAITGTNWNGHRFFGLRKSRDAK
jgi:hypothetical protein